MDRDLKLIYAGLALCVLIICFGCCMSIRQSQAQERCVEEGGHVERYNYRTVFIQHSCGSNCFYLMPVEMHDWRCVK